MEIRPHSQATARTGAHGAACEPRERNAAMSAIAAALLVAVVIASVAIVRGQTQPAGVVVQSAAPTPAPDRTPAERPIAAKTAAAGPAEADPAPTGGASEATAAEPDQATGAPVRKLGFSVRTEDPPERSERESPPASGTGGSGTGAGGGAGPGSGGGSFMGLPVTGRRIAYVIDHSTSMSIGTRIDAARAELERSILALRQDQLFTVVLFGSSTRSLTAGQLVRADAAGKGRAIKWLERFDRDNVTDVDDPSDAIRLALACNPDTVFLLTDGKFDPKTVPDAIRALNGDGASVINTIALHCAEGEELLRQVASDNGGKYNFVPMPTAPGTDGP